MGSGGGLVVPDERRGGEGSAGPLPRAVQHHRNLPSLTGELPSLTGELPSPTGEFPSLTGEC
eukprot:3145703-Pyramimonas_sp.AAC.1